MDQRTGETSVVITGLTDGDNVAYRVRALGTGLYVDSAWSASKEFFVCPMDVNGDGDISGLDRVYLSKVWLAEKGDENYLYYADIDGNGDISGPDRVYLVKNWLAEVSEEGLVYPRARAADQVFAAYDSGDIEVDLDIF